MSPMNQTYDNLCRELGIEEWPEVKDKLGADNVQEILEAATAFKNAFLASKKASDDYDNYIYQTQGIPNTDNECWEERRRLKEERTYAFRVHDQRQSQLMTALHGEDYEDEEPLEVNECIVS